MKKIKIVFSGGKRLNKFLEDKLNRGLISESFIYSF